ncbi:tRNA (uridine(34)/cytosine(34)/5-carboxymethylaminomethyluridine(34)-2'-O)-methyltransferase TrmL [Geothermobacter hydrogeniphilus]|uniref:Putative tRNA (cytidine(34)-2'-O)-methyltransferase n=1 Tax=Geothermobacter hydrogeniphilus TaxID=1969733 RepID=A0A2K2H9N7_9BACT|nr:tRNA (cytidine(34)-2'-O)-methyltransferase [Geothermobacter hydrogeniphilus]PNU20038.1 tRNA (uridine(34)/cytosine(34)/5-carboxymethylaminomethyluridine(34)-2'-O)-methyltransferase TrmL [Geothermobacter hydrogeniphilus]
MKQPPLHIVLIEPEIPPNTGNIARLCAATGIHLHLVGRLGFSLDDRHLKRAGLDYWPAVQLRRWENFPSLRAAYPQARFWYASKKARKSYTRVDYQKGDFLVFGKETKGLPETILAEAGGQAIRIPIFTESVRSLNLSTAAGIVAYEALRQLGMTAG